MVRRQLLADRRRGGLLLVDTHASAVAAREVLDDVRRLGAGDVVAVVNTHEHFDHTFGNAELRGAYGAGIPIHAHETAAERTVAAGERIKGLYRDDPDDPHREEVLATEIVPADHTFSSATVLDLGDRMVELVHPGRGHTGGDLVVRVPDADVLLAGDLVEESAARDGVPGFGGDCYPLEWPLTLDIVLGLTTQDRSSCPATAHPSAATSSSSSATTSASSPRRSATSPPAGCRSTKRSTPPSGRSRGPSSTNAVRRGYEHLPRSQKRLPLI